MPIYEYTCESCGHELEALQGLNDDLLADCPECGDSALRKRISRVAFRLKGSGWYETDFKDKDKRNVAGEGGSDSGEGSGSGGESGSSNGESGSSSDGSASGEASSGGQSGGASQGDGGSSGKASSSGSGSGGAER